MPRDDRPAYGQPEPGPALAAAAAFVAAQEALEDAFAVGGAEGGAGRR